MLFLYIVFIFVLIIWGIKFEDNDDFISKERCNSIKGIFILLIVLTHSMQYINNSGYEYEGIDMFVPFFKNKMGQMVVVMFLFYSGYGVYLSIKKKGKAYVNQMPRRKKHSDKPDHQTPRMQSVYQSCCSEGRLRCKKNPIQQSRQL